MKMTFLSCWYKWPYPKLRLCSANEKGDEDNIRDLLSVPTGDAYDPWANEDICVEEKCCKKMGYRSNRRENESYSGFSSLIPGVAFNVRT